MNNQEQKVMELVVFKLNEGADTTAFIAAAAELTSELEKGAPGYLERSLLHTPDKDQWVDVIYWSSMEHALGAFELMEPTHAFQAFGSMIDMQQSSMYHLVPLHER